MGHPSQPAGDYLTIAQTADTLGVKPWEVVRLIEAGELTSATVIPATALADYTQERSA